MTNPAHEASAAGDTAVARICLSLARPRNFRGPIFLPDLL